MFIGSKYKLKVYLLSPVLKLQGTRRFKLHILAVNKSNHSDKYSAFNSVSHVSHGERQVDEVGHHSREAHSRRTFVSALFSLASRHLCTGNNRDTKQNER